MAEHEQDPAVEAVVAVGGERHVIQDETPTVCAPPLAARIAAAMLEAKQVTKSSRNTQQNYNFASAEQILAAVREPLFKRDIILVPSVLGYDEQSITSGKGAEGSRVIIDVEFTFSDGLEVIRNRWRGEGQDYGDKAFGKAYTNAVKTFIRTAWLLPTDHDDPEGSDPGERATGQSPPWQRPATDARRGELVKLLGQSGADALAAQIEGAWGLLPDGAVAIVKALVPPTPAATDPPPPAGEEPRAWRSD